ncbi:unnamed protein product [Rangifer tarandus platyrhynchus]|uniref:Secreted protein n=1 Tax=Rangifer tarandus platyrhynchus TaxID=3082113 RepID=A0ABN8Z2K8_RANTA|nr:unnamed protein product [Rangifer tarandus platyrhynchus]
MLVVSLALPWAQVAASCFPEGTVVGTEPDSSARLARRRLAPKIPLERWEKRLCRLQAPLPPIPRPADDGDVLAGSSQVGVTHLEEASAESWVEPRQREERGSIANYRRQTRGSAHV